MALLRLDSPIALTPAQRACLGDFAGGPLRLGIETDVRGMRVFFYSRPGAGRHSGATIFDLGRHGFCETGPKHDDFLITEAGRKWLRDVGA